MVVGVSSERPATEEITFTGGSQAHLSGVLHRPPERARGLVLMAHCFTCSKDIHTMTRLANALTEAGYAAFRFDFTGRGESEGDFAKKTLSANVSDVVRAAATLVEMGFGPCGIIGHSLGGAAVLLAAEKIRTLEAVITIGAPSDAGHVRHLFADDEDELLSAGRAVVSISGRKFELEAGFLHDLEIHNVLDSAAALGLPYLTVHADDDNVVPVTEGEALHAAAAEPKEFLRYPTGGHLFADRTAAALLASDIVTWLDRVLDR